MAGDLIAFDGQRLKVSWFEVPSEEILQGRKRNKLKAALGNFGNVSFIVSNDVLKPDFNIEGDEGGTAKYALHMYEGTLTMSRILLIIPKWYVDLLCSLCVSSSSAVSQLHVSIVLPRRATGRTTFLIKRVKRLVLTMASFRFISIVVSNKMAIEGDETRAAGEATAMPHFRFLTASNRCTTRGTIRATGEWM